MYTNALNVSWTARSYNMQNVRQKRGTITRSQNSEKWLISFFTNVTSVRPRCPRRTDFIQIWYMNINRYSVDKNSRLIKIWHESNGYNTRSRLYIMKTYSRIRLRMRNVSDKVVIKPHFVFNVYPPLENRAVYEMSKIRYCQIRHILQYGARAFHAIYLRK